MRHSTNKSNITPLISPCPVTLDGTALGREEAAVFVRAADRAGGVQRPGPAADSERHLQLHHAPLPLLPDRRQGLAGGPAPGSDRGCGVVAGATAFRLASAE